MQIKCLLTLLYHFNHVHVHDTRAYIQVPMYYIIAQSNKPFVALFCVRSVALRHDNKWLFDASKSQVLDI